MIEVDRSENARDDRQRLRLLGAVHGQRAEQRRLLLTLDRRRPHVLEPDEGLRRASHGNQSCDIGVGSTGRCLGRLAQFEFKPRSGPAAARRRRLRLLDRRRPLVHEARDRDRVHPLGHGRHGRRSRCGRPGRLRGLPGRRRHARAAARARSPRVERARLRGRAVRVHVRLRLRAGRLERPHLGRSDAGATRTRPTRSSTRRCPARETPTGTTLLDGHATASAARRRLPRQDDERRWQLGDLAGRPAAEGPPVLQRHRRLRRAAARRLPRHAQRHARRGRPARPATSARSRSRTSGSAGRSARRTRTRASRRGTHARPTAARAGRTRRVSSGSYALNYEQFGNRDVPFFGDYNYISASASNVLMALAERAGHRARDRSALHGRQRHRRLRRPPVPDLRATALGRRHLPRRGRARQEHLRVRRS